MRVMRVNGPSLLEQLYYYAASDVADLLSMEVDQNQCLASVCTAVSGFLPSWLQNHRVDLLLEPRRLISSTSSSIS